MELYIKLKLVHAINSQFIEAVNYDYVASWFHL